MELTKTESEFLESLLEKDDDGVRVPSKNFRILWQGNELMIHELNCGRFNIRETGISMDGIEETTQSKRLSNIQRQVAYLTILLVIIYNNIYAINVIALK